MFYVVPVATDEGSELARAGNLTSRRRSLGVSIDPVRWGVGLLEIQIRVRWIRGSVAPITILTTPRARDAHARWRCHRAGGRARSSRTARAIRRPGWRGQCARLSARQVVRRKLYINATAPRSVVGAGFVRTEQAWSAKFIQAEGGGKGAVHARARHGEGGQGRAREGVSGSATARGGGRRVWQHSSSCQQGSC
eukprot:6192973-Pleurochrysis_carterae.AAC.1